MLIDLVDSAEPSKISHAHNVAVVLTAAFDHRHLGRCINFGVSSYKSAQPNCMVLPPISLSALLVLKHQYLCVFLEFQNQREQVKCLVTLLVLATFLAVNLATILLYNSQ
jgi:hypothetical protein